MARRPRLRTPPMKLAKPTLLMRCVRLFDGDELLDQGVRIRREGALYELSAPGSKPVLTGLANVEVLARRMRPHPDVLALLVLVAGQHSAACAVSIRCITCKAFFNPLATRGLHICLGCGRKNGRKNKKRRAA